jgi:hypothetical protein
MAVSVVPALIDALIAAAETAGVENVYDGVHVSEDPGDFLMVGVDDPDSDGGSLSADSRQQWANANHTTRDESGSVTCAAYSWNGDGDQKAARDAAYVMVEALASACRTTPGLGVGSLLWTDFGSDANLSQLQGDWGASALVVFTIAFRARI